MQKGKMFFNIIICITVIALICVIGYISYYYISNYLAVKEAEEAVDKFENEIVVVEIEDPIIEENTQIDSGNEQPVQNTSKKSSSISYRGYTVIGTIQIPKTKVKSPIVDKVTPSSIAAAVGTLYGPGLNQVGNTVLAAHNYRNRNILF